MYAPQNVSFFDSSWAAEATRLVAEQWISTSLGVVPIEMYGWVSTHGAAVTGVCTAGTTSGPVSDICDLLCGYRLADLHAGGQIFELAHRETDRAQYLPRPEPGRRQ